MQEHELIDRDVPRCLYCNSDVDVDLRLTWISGRQPGRGDIETLSCRQCKEMFRIYSNQDTLGETNILGFMFSCNKIFIYHHYNSDTIFLGRDDRIYSSALDPNPTHFPAFTMNFSDKKKLHSKLQTYLVFS
jgi:hypothetical protein